MISKMISKMTVEGIEKSHQKGVREKAFAKHNNDIYSKVYVSKNVEIHSKTLGIIFCIL
jgi:hypothetical protein